MLEIDSKYFLQNLLELTLICNEGAGRDLVKEAMRAGVGGATMGKLKYHCPQGMKPRGMSSAREACSMCVAESQADRIIHALEKANAFKESASGEIVIRNSPKAYTYS